MLPARLERKSRKSTEETQFIDLTEKIRKLPNKSKWSLEFGSFIDTTRTSLKWGDSVLDTLEDKDLRKQLSVAKQILREVSEEVSGEAYYSLFTNIANCAIAICDSNIEANTM